MLYYAENLEYGAASIKDNGKAIISEESEEVPLAKMGWARKHASTSRRQLSEKQKNYLIDLFLLGEKTGRKADASKVSMRKVHNDVSRNGS